MHRGYLTPPVIIALALITLFVAGTIYVNTFFLKDVKNEPAVSTSPSPAQSPTPSTRSSPKASTSPIGETAKKSYQENIRSCVGASNYTYEFYVTFVSSVTQQEAREILTSFNAQSISDQKVGNTFYVFFADGEICSSVNELKKSDKVRRIDTVPYLPTSN